MIAYLCIVSLHNIYRRLVPDEILVSFCMYMNLRESPRDVSRINEVTEEMGASLFRLLLHEHLKIKMGVIKPVHTLRTRKPVHIYNEALRVPGISMIKIS